MVNRLAVSQGAYWLANARVGIETQRAGGNWSASFWVKNLADKEYFGQVFQSGTANAVSATGRQPAHLGLSNWGTGSDQHDAGAMDIHTLRKFDKML